MAELSAEEVLSTLVYGNAERLSPAEFKAFDDMAERVDAGLKLTPKQADWVFSVGERLGICTAPARNVFSKMTEEKRQEHRALVRTKLPWEQGMPRPLKPPGR